MLHQQRYFDDSFINISSGGKCGLMAVIVVSILLDPPAPTQDAHPSTTTHNNCPPQGNLISNSQCERYPSQKFDFIHKPKREKHLKPKGRPFSNATVAVQSLKPRIQHLALDSSFATCRPDHMYIHTSHMSERPEATQQILVEC